MSPCAGSVDCGSWVNALADIQRLVVRGINLQCGRWLLLRIDKPEQTRQFIAALLAKEWISNACIPSLVAEQERTGETQIATNIGLTWEGLSALGPPAQLARAFQSHPEAKPFVAGAPARARKLGDTGPSRVGRWDERFLSAHVLISVFADELSDIEQRVQSLRELNNGKTGLSGWDHPLDTAHLDQDRKRRMVHFGFRDGISQPVIRRPDTLHTDVNPSLFANPGEFLLGYDNNCGRNPWSADEVDKDLAAFVRNGSFSACRQIRQDVQAFERFVSRAAADAGDGVSEDLIKAKLCGRWPNGAPLRAGESSMPQIRPGARLNDFDYTDDPDGQTCPFGAHVRRSNPRADAVLARCKHTDTGSTVRSRPLMRRGMPYGPRWSEDTQGQERGLMGLFVCASLQEQFEHVMTHWVDRNPVGLGNPDTAKDPLVGNQNPSANRFHIPGADEEIVLEGLGAFCKTRGTTYLFHPAISALQRIAAW